jgi:hypothetical protein
MEVGFLHAQRKRVSQAFEPGPHGACEGLRWPAPPGFLRCYASLRRKLLIGVKTGAASRTVNQLPNRSCRPGSVGRRFSLAATDAVLTRRLTTGGATQELRARSLSLSPLALVFRGAGLQWLTGSGQGCPCVRSETPPRNAAGQRQGSPATDALLVRLSHRLGKEGNVRA